MFKFIFKNPLFISYIGLLLFVSMICPAAVFAKDRLVKGDIQRSRVNKLTGSIHWHKSLAQAQSDARSRGKMIFWVNILGRLDGAT